jgi:hypothetical protein
MYTNVWNKYLPIIRILLKKSAAADQTLDLNLPDFERAGIARKSGYKFNIVFSKGRVDNVIISSPLASNLAQVLLGDPVIKELFMKNDYHVGMNTKFQMSFKCIANVEEAVTADAASETAGN